MDKRPGRWLQVAMFSAASLVAMTAIDYAIGAEAEFLNAYSVWERLLGREPSAGLSHIAEAIGPMGELAMVLAANLMVGMLLTGIVQLVRRD